MRISSFAILSQCMSLLGIPIVKPPPRRIYCMVIHETVGGKFIELSSVLLGKNASRGWFSWFVAWLPYKSKVYCTTAYAKLSAIIGMF